MDKIVFDVETKNSFEDVGGYNHIQDLEVSVIGAYSYNQDKYFCFEDKELQKFGELLKQAELLIGFSSKSFDIPVLKKYYNFNIAAIPHFDILEEIEKILGRRIGLGLLAEANIGLSKTSNGLEAITMYQKGEIEKLKNYCLQDVRITKEIFDFIREKGYLWIPQKNNPQMIKINITFKDISSSQEKLI